MVRSCLGATVSAAIALTTFGCAGQTIEGSWIGPMPLGKAKACRIKIYSDHRFDVAVSDMSWVGAGKYERHGNDLILRFNSLVYHGQPERRPPELHLAFEGKGNTLLVGEAGDRQKPYVWHRQRL